MSVLLNDLRYAARMLLNNPGFTVAVVLTLALAIGVNTAMFSLVNTIVFAPLPVEDPDRMVRVFRDPLDSDDLDVFSYPDYCDYRDRSDVFENLAAYAFLPVAVETAEGSETRFGQVVTGNYFATLGARALVGRMLTPSDDLTPGGHPVVVLSHRYWQAQLAGAVDAVGRTVMLSGRPYTVVGIAAPGFTGASPVPSPDFWIPIAMIGQLRPEMSNQLEQRGSVFLLSIARLKHGVSLDQALAGLQVTAAGMVEVDPERYEGEKALVVPANGLIPMTPDMRRVATMISALVMAMVGLVLLVGCANVANLLLARSVSRRREIGIRLSLGAPRRRIVRQMLTESVFLSFLGGVAGLVLSAWTLDLMVAALPAMPFNVAIDLDFAIDKRVLLYTAAVAMLSGILFGLFPALGATRVDLNSTLKDDRGAGRFGFRRSRLRSALVVAQVASSLVLLIVAGLFVRSLLQARAIDPGFNHENILAVAFDLGARSGEEADTTAFCRELLERARALPGVGAACIEDCVPLTLTISSTNFWIEGQEYADPEEGGTGASYSSVSSDSFRTLGIPLLQGRDFNDGDSAGSSGVVIVNQEFADRFWPGETPLGKRISNTTAEGPYLEVVGVAKTTKYWLIGEEPRPHVYLPISQNPREFMATLLVRTTGDPLIAAAPIREIIREIEPELALASTGRLTELIGFILLPARFAAAGFGLFGLLALVLASVGLYGVMSYTANQRMHEIGIRTALGAQRGDIIRMMLKQGIRLTAIGLVIGLVIALAGTRLLSNLLYGIGATDPLTFIVVSLVLAGVALLASWIPARRATMVDPAVTLRFE
jgi:predicted permease